MTHTIHRFQGINLRRWIEVKFNGQDPSSSIVTQVCCRNISSSSRFLWHIKCSMELMSLVAVWMLDKLCARRARLWHFSKRWNSQSMPTIWNRQENFYFNKKIIRRHMVKDGKSHKIPTKLPSVGSSPEIAKRREFSRQKMSCIEIAHFS